MWIVSCKLAFFVSDLLSYYRGYKQVISTTNDTIKIINVPLSAVAVHILIN